MTRITKQDRNKIEQVRKKKERTLEKVTDILRHICKDNPHVFKKAAEDRVKSLERIEERIKNIKRCTVSNFEKYIRDIAGARVTCCTLDEIAEAETLIKKHPEVKQCRVLRKYEEGPDEDGYRGHHLEVTVHVFYENKTFKDICEVQIRTLAGDLWAVLSHRDFYRSPTKPPPSVQADMRTLSKQLEVIDELAMSLKQRIREEVSREAKERAKTKLAEKDMLTPENVRNLVDKTLKKKISVDYAYELIQYVLSFDVASLKEYKGLITKYRTMIEDIFNGFKVKPRVADYLYAPVFLKQMRIRAWKRLLLERAQAVYEETMALVEKGVEISKEKLDKQVKISGPTERKKKR